MRLRVLVPAVLVAVLVAGLAGCGNTGAPGNAASAVPADVAAYASVDTSLEGDQWRAARELLREFPAGERALDELLDEAAEEAGLAGGDDLEGALGPEVGIAVLDVPQERGEKAPVVLLTRPDDEDAFAELLEGADAARDEMNGWQVVAADAATIERYRDALDEPSLADSAEFDEAMDDLDDGALLHVYLDGNALVDALASRPGFPAGALPLLSGGELGSIGATLEAEEGGVRVEGRLVPREEPAGAPAAEPHESELTGEVPGGVIAFVSFADLGSSLGEAAGAGPGLLPFDLGGIAELFSGESALYVRPGSPEPSLTLVTEVEDEAEALRSAEGLLGFAGAQADGLVYDAFDGLLAVSTSEEELDALRGDGPRLEQDDAFERAAEQAGLPDETTGFGYVDLQTAAPLVLGLAPAGGAAVPEPSDLEPLGGVVFWGGTTDDVQRFSLFVGVG